MDINLGSERAYNLIPQITLDVARDRIEQKKTNLIAGTVGALFNRPKAEEFQMVSVENRLESFWMVSVMVHTVYDRSKNYTVTLSGSEIQQVTVLGQDLPVATSPKGDVSFTLTGVEHCAEERKVTNTYDSITGEKADFSKYLSFPKTEIVDLEQFAPTGTFVVPPQVHATAVIRPVLAEVIQPVKALVIHEERVDVEAIDLNFHPVYAFEYEWTTKAKRVILEMDGMTGEIRTTSGKKFSDHIKSIITRDLLFDMTADAASLIVPGGSIAVRVVKAVTSYHK